MTDFAADGSAPAAGPGARLSCQGLPAALLGTAVHLKGSAEQVGGNSVERAKQNGDMSVFVKCYTVCSKAASKWAPCQLPTGVSHTKPNPLGCCCLQMSEPEPFPAAVWPCCTGSITRLCMHKALCDTPVLLIFPVYL